MPTYSEPTIVNIQKSHQVFLGAYLGVLAGMVAIGFGGYFYWRILQATQMIHHTNQDIAQKEQRLQELQPIADELNTYNRLAQELHNLFDHQVDWNVAMGNIENRLYKRMAITALQVSDDHLFTFSGYTSSYLEYAKIYTSLTDATAKKYFLKAKPVSLSKVEKKEGDSGGGLPEGTITFTFSLTVAPTILKPVAP